jgi:hypothetical protein
MQVCENEGEPVMAINKTRMVLGGVLLLIGLLSLLNNLHLFRLSEEYVLSTIFLGSGLVLAYHGQAAQRKWVRYLGFALVIIGAMIFIDEAAFLPDEMIGTLWLWLLAGILYRLYQLNSKRWWVLLFAGPAFVIGLVIFLEGFQVVRSELIAVLINMGFAATFAYLYSIRSLERKLEWAKYPAVGFFLIAIYLFLADEYEGAIPFALSGMFILSGLYLIYRTLRTDLHSSDAQQHNASTLTS